MSCRCRFRRCASARRTCSPWPVPSRRSSQGPTSRWSWHRARRPPCGPTPGRGTCASCATSWSASTCCAATDRSCSARRPSHGPLAPAAPTRPTLGDRSYREHVEDFERELIRAALQEGGSIAGAARLLQVDRGNLYRRIKALQISAP
ncbi:helix-turn-helix domain-containing protein [Pyxidicoccus sp. 3LFB2]